jgi:hypothetical protein
MSAHDRYAGKLMSWDGTAGVIACVGYRHAARFERRDIRHGEPVVGCAVTYSLGRDEDGEVVAVEVRISPKE